MTKKRSISRERQIRVVAIHRKTPDLKALARALIAVAEQELDQENARKLRKGGI